MNKKTYIALGILLAISLFITIKNLRAQAHVDSVAYDSMLSTLLSHSVPEVTVEDAIEDSDVIYFDARSREEFNVSHIRNAIWVGYDEFDADRVEGIDKSGRIIIYCSVGYRSEKITEKLIALGFTDVSNLYGGIFEWINKGYPVVDSNGLRTYQIHAYSKSWGIWLNRGDKVY